MSAIRSSERAPPARAAAGLFGSDTDGHARLIGRLKRLFASWQRPWSTTLAPPTIPPALVLLIRVLARRHARELASLQPTDRSPTAEGKVAMTHRGRAAPSRRQERR